MMLSVFLLAAFVAILAYGLRTAIQVEVDSTLGHRRPLSSAAPSVGPPEPIAVLAIASRVRPIEAVSGVINRAYSSPALPAARLADG